MFIYEKYVTFYITGIIKITAKNQFKIFPPPNLHQKKEATPSSAFTKEMRVLTGEKQQTSFEQAV